ncbi:VanZ family protein [Streptomyces physcomitrii]|uniref:VanZ family protein n=1 Tax=Streptomyces physcomitrii TaxID=2724184 RepID=A0ABX1GZP0_9ACTN|nr:VanZ family protein [Streptomyces physcomitrii]NKI40474.1 VanZ family protein [Streptomyces physcomitrii]
MQRQGSGGGIVAVPLRAAGVVLLVAHLLVVAWLTLRPVEVAWVSAPNLHPLAGIRADFAQGWWPGLRRVGKDLFMLAPLGFLLPLIAGRVNASPFFSLMRTTATGVVVSMWIGLLQTYIPGQVVDVDSLLLNTLGVIVTHLAVVPWARARLRRRSGADGTGAGSQGPTPTIARVEFAPWGDALRRP